MVDVLLEEPQKKFGGLASEPAGRQADWQVVDGPVEVLRYLHATQRLNT